MGKNSGSTRAINSQSASASRKNNYSKWNADYISSKTKEINSFKMPKQNDSEYINIKGIDYRVRHEKTYDGRHIVDILRNSDGYSFGREIYTNSGSYGYASTGTKSEATKSIKNELLSILKNQ